MSVTDVQTPPTFTPPVAEFRRFQIPDLDRHGGWLLKRLLLAFPHLDQRSLIGWLRGLISLNECLFLYQDHSVALAQVERSHTLAPKPRVIERFVFCQDPQYEDEAAAFYPKIATWARHQSVPTLEIKVLTDVPDAKIRKALASVGCGKWMDVVQTLVKVE